MKVDQAMSISAKPRGCTGGFTMVEVMIALAVTGLVGAAVSAMLVSVSYGTSSQADLRRISVKERVIAIRMNTAISSSKMILDQGADHLVLWMGDSRQNGLPDLSEIRRIDRDATTLQITSYIAPIDLSDAANTQYSFADDFDAVTLALRGTADFPGEIWATGVTAWSQARNQTNPQAATLLSYNLTLAGDDVTGTVVHTLSLRSR